MGKVRGARPRGSPAALGQSSVSTEGQVARSRRERCAVLSVTVHGPDGPPSNHAAPVDRTSPLAGWIDEALSGSPPPWTAALCAWRWAAGAGPQLSGSPCCPWRSSALSCSQVWRNLSECVRQVAHHTQQVFPAHRNGLPGFLPALEAAEQVSRPLCGAGRLGLWPLSGGLMLVCVSVPSRRCRTSSRQSIQWTQKSPKPR